MAKTAKCVLVHEVDGSPAKVGDKLTDFRGEKCVLVGWKEPYHPETNLFQGGKIYCEKEGIDHQNQWYPSVCGLKFVLIPDRQPGEHEFADCGGVPKCVTCGADEDDAFVGGEQCSYREAEMTQPK